MTTPSVTVSVVSHGHGSFVKSLLKQLSDLSGNHVAKIVLTTNVPEPELLEWINRVRWVFCVQVIQNEQPRGFGDNHNRAFKACKTPYFCVLNPDIELASDPFQNLLPHFEKKQTGCVYPLQTNGVDRPQDQAREIPTPWALFKRYFWPRYRSEKAARHWVNGSFLLFRSAVFDELHGFDTAFYMYCEDVDVCLRLQLAGYVLRCAQNAEITHFVQRKSHRHFRHVAWHIASLGTLWQSDSYKKFRAHKRQSKLI